MKNYSDIINASKYDHSALVLFGSYSRGDFNSESDIDVLEITKQSQRPYSNDKINFATYTFEQLRQMANDGNLFVLHILEEGQLLTGNSEIIDSLKKEFKKLASYDSLRKEILLTAKLLDIEIDKYLGNPRGYYGLLCYLFRSFLYSKIYDEGKVNFSIKRVAKYFGDDRILRVFELKYQHQVSFPEFDWCKKLFEEYAGEKFQNEFGTANNLLGKFKSTSSFMMSIGIHFLKDSIEEIGY